MSSLLSRTSQKPWEEVLSVSTGASVFLDDGAAEALHWCEAEEELLRASLGVYSLGANLNPVAKDFIAQAPYCHVIIVCTSPLIGQCAERIAAVLSDIQPLECHVFCSVSESMHEEFVPIREQGGCGYSHYGEFQAMIKKWIRRESGVRVTVSHVELFHVEVLPNLFCTPVYHNSVFSLTPSDIPVLQKYALEVDPNCVIESLSNIQFNCLPQNYQKSIKLFTHSFNSLLSSMDLHDDIFSIGPTARLLADQLSTSEESRLRRKTASKKCSVLFVDRTFDLATPTSHCPDHFLDRILSQLPSLNVNSNDIAINMEPLSQVDTRYIVPGHLAHPGHSKAMNIIKSLAFAKQKEALMDLSRALLEALAKEKISSKSVGRVGRPSSSQVKSFMELFKSNPGALAKHNQLLQLSCAVVEVMKDAKPWDITCEEEKRLMQCAVSGDCSVVQCVIRIVQSQLLDRNSDEVAMADVFCLLVMFYSLLGEECYTHHTEEITLKESLGKVIQLNRSCDTQFLSSIGFGDNWSLMEVMVKLDGIFDCLNSLMVARNELNCRDLVTTDNRIHPFVLTLIESICDPTRPELTDIRHHSQGLGNILRSSLRFFTSSTKPRPGDNPLLIVFMVGGVSVAEIRAVNDFIANKKPNLEVCVGACKLMSPQRTVIDLLSKEKLLK